MHQRSDGGVGGRRLLDVLSGKVQGDFGVSEDQVRGFEQYANVSFEARAVGARALAGEVCTAS